MTLEIYFNNKPVKEISIYVGHMSATTYAFDSKDGFTYRKVVVNTEYATEQASIPSIRIEATKTDGTVHHKTIYQPISVSYVGFEK